MKREYDEMVTSDQIEKYVRNLTDDDQNGDGRVKSLKENCDRIKELAKKSVSKDGSSSKNLDMICL